MTTPVIGIDLMGGDHPPLRLFENLLGFEEESLPFPNLVFFATADLIPKFEKIVSARPERSKISFVEAENIILMDDDPLTALRSKKKASIPLGIEHLAQKKLDGFISLGNTGALIGASKLHLKMLKGIQRPALLALLPTKLKPLAVLDVGANITCRAEHLVQFAAMGLSYQKCFGIKNPKIGLLNIGSEKKKGRLELVEAYQLLQSLNTNKDEPVFIGNVEGKEAFKGHVNVLITDGFSGNIFLKTAEGMTAYILERILEEGLDKHKESSFYTFAHDLNYAEYPGALICGVDKIVIKCHGYSNSKAILSALKGAINLVETRFLEKLTKQLGKNL